MTAAEAAACSLAQNIARTCGFAVFPCRENKRPASSHGFKQAAKDPDEIAELWRHWPGSLIGVATGPASGIVVLDCDRKHAEAIAWWKRNHHRLLPTRVYQTRSGGLHLYFNDRPGVSKARHKQAQRPTKDGSTNGGTADG